MIEIDIKDTKVVVENNREIVMIECHEAEVAQSVAAKIALIQVEH